MIPFFSVGGLSIRFSLEEQIVFAKNAGFDGIDYIATPKDLFSYPKEHLQLAKKHNIKIKSVHIPLVFVFFIPPFIQRRLISFLRYFPDSTLFNLHLSGFFSPIPLQRGIKNLEKFCRLAKKNNIALSFESNGNDYFFLQWYPKKTWDPDEFAQFCIKHHLPINMDTSHVASLGYDIVEFYKKYNEHIHLIHMSDRSKEKQHLTFGRGNLPLKKLFEEMKKTHYKGIVIFEVFNHPQALTKEEVQKDITDSINLFKRTVA